MVLNSVSNVRVITVVVICGFLYFLNCTKNIAGSEVTNEESVKLVGKVLDQKGSGIPNIVAKVEKLNLTDTTDDGGNYSFSVSPGVLQTASIKLDTLKDSVKIYNSGNIVSNIQITNWIDTLPNVYLVQRSVYGKLLTTDTVFKAITAVITIFDNNNLQILSIEKNLWFNNGTLGFSGFTYFDNDASKHYSVYIKVFNKDSIYTGKSKTIYFDKSAGDIEIPSFDPYTNPKLKISLGNDTTLTINDTILLSAKTITGTISNIRQWEWNINGSGFKQVSDQDTTMVLPDSVATVTCIIKAIDSTEFTLFDTMKIYCENDFPNMEIFAGDDTTLTINDTLKLKLSIDSIANVHSRIKSLEWNIDSSGFYKTSSDDTLIILPDFEKKINCIVKARDSLGNTAMDTIIIDCVNDKPSLMSLNNLQFATKSTTVFLKAFAYDSQTKPLHFQWNVETIGNYIQSNGIQQNYWDPRDTSEIVFTTPDIFTDIQIKVTVSDDDGNDTSQTIILSVGDWESAGSYYQLTPDMMISRFPYNNGFLYKSNITKINDTYNIQLEEFKDSSWFLKGKPFAISYNEKDSIVCQPKCLLAKNGTLCLSTINRNVSGQNYCVFYQIINGSLTISKSDFFTGTSINSVELNTLNDNFFLSGIIDNTTTFLYQCSTTNVEKIDLGNYNSPQNLITCSDSTSLYICGKYISSSNTPLYYLKKYSNGVLQSYSKDLNFYYHYSNVGSYERNGTITSMQLLKDSLYFGINWLKSETMHSSEYYFTVNKYVSDTTRQIGNSKYFNWVNICKLLVVSGKLVYTTPDPLNSLYILK